MINISNETLNAACMNTSDYGNALDCLYHDVFPNYITAPEYCVPISISSHQSCKECRCSYLPVCACMGTIFMNTLYGVLLG